MYSSFSDWDFTKGSSPIWNSWITSRIVARLVWEREWANTQVTGIKDLYHVFCLLSRLFCLVRVVVGNLTRNITLLFLFLRYNLPVPQEESMKASVVEARLRTKLRESFQVRKRYQMKKRVKTAFKRSRATNYSQSSGLPKFKLHR